MSVQKFIDIFDGLAEAYGTFKIEKTSATGKMQGKAAVVRESRTTVLWENHLKGKTISARSQGSGTKDPQNEITFGGVSQQVWWRTLFSFYQRVY
jgi:hypothetical protein